jgi:UPF0755 protein
MSSRWKVGISSSLSLILMAVLGLSLIFRAPTDFSKDSARSPVEISVATGESGSSIAQTLQREGVILNAKKFIGLALSDPRSLSISPGEHLIDRHIPSEVALEQLLDPKRNRGLIRVIEGSTVSDVLSTLKVAGVAGVNSKVQLPTGFSRPKGSDSLEGFLFPSTYSFAKGTDRSQALTAMVKNFAAQIAGTKLLQGYGHFTPYQVLTVASLIQIEADEVDYAKAARVIYNRLAINMPLQLNSTVQYALNLRGKIALSRQQTQFPSPYNTYLHTGLTPTPVSNPGLIAIRAALEPAAGDWLYFITVKPHDTRFTKSFSEFQTWVTLYNNNLANGLFK